MSPWAEDVDPADVHSEYPRPQMIREDWKNLNGMWNYAVTADDAQYAAQGQILVPYPLESSLSGVGKKLAKNEARNTMCY